jgi:hypothetical protein
MYTIDAYDVDAEQATSDSTDKRHVAMIKAFRLAKEWPMVEVRNPSDLNPDNQPIAGWINGERQF